MEIGTRIKELRIEHHLSQEALAEKLNLSRQAVTKWENNISMPSTANLLELAKLFHISTEELIFPTEEAKDEKKKVKQWVKYILLFFTIVFIILSLIASFKFKQMRWLPDNVIGYGDGPTGIFELGIPIYLYLLYGLTALLSGTTMFMFFKRK